MLIETDKKAFDKYFPVAPHPFISEPFIELNSSKVNNIVRLVDDSGEVTMGLIAGIKNDVLQSPFSAPFGGFHFRKENIYISEIDRFADSLRSYVVIAGLKRIELTIPPDIYHPTFNSKTVNSLIRHGFQCTTPEITNWVDLRQFDGPFTQKNSREYYRQAVRNGLTFAQTSDEREKEDLYNLVAENRAKYGRPIFMTLNDIHNTGNIWPVDFFKVSTSEGMIAASAIFYRFHSKICYAVFWGDNDAVRPLRAMDYLVFNLWSHYKNLGFKYVDLGISTETGSPNEGLLRFKESHEAASSLRYKFIWES